jgi:tRNA pseudouridine32 synthase/23S rRNA pseudouridine746 synthase
MAKKMFKKVVKKGDPLVASDFVASKLDLSKEKVKKAMMNGSCWLKKQSIKGLNRIRKAKTPIRVGDTIEFYYDPDIEFPSTEGFDVFHENKHFGVWKKMPGMLSQGTRYGDAGSVLKEVTAQKKQAFLIHRLDREVGGLMVVGYTSQAATKLSDLFKTGGVETYYRAWVKGIPKQNEGVIEKPLDDKPSKTTYKVIDKFEDKALLEIRIYTGRNHQIRRHLDFIGHPVMGDPKYGKRNKDDRGLQLVSYKLKFEDPFFKKPLKLCLDEEDISFFLTI